MTFSNHEIEHLVNFVKESGWPLAVGYFLKELSPPGMRLLRSELAKRHVGWIGLLDKGLTGTAVVIENGLGACSVAFSNRFEEVIAVCSDENHAFLLAARAKYLAIGNLKIVAGIKKLELIEDGSADVIAAYDDEFRSMGNDQVLRQVDRILKPYGQMAVVLTADKRIRFCCDGRKSVDVNWYRKKIKGYFSNIDRFRYTGQSVRDVYQLQKMDLEFSDVFHLKRWIGHIKSSIEGGGFLFLCSRNNEHISSFESLLMELSNRAVLFDSLRPDVLNVIMSKPRGALMLTQPKFKGKSGYVIRVAYDELTHRRYRNNATALEFLKNLPGCLMTTPVQIDSGKSAGLDYFVETRLAGTNVRPEQIDNVNRLEYILSQSVECLTDLHCRTLNLTEMQDELYIQLIKSPLIRARHNFGSAAEGTAENDIFDQIEAYLENKFVAQRLPLVFCHGDFSLDNILVASKSDKVIGVFDWDYSISSGLPLTDLLFLLSSSLRKTKGYSMAKSLLIFFNIALAPVVYKSAVEKYCDSIGLDKRMISPLALMVVVNFMACRLEMEEDYSQPDYYQAMFGDLLTGMSLLLKRGLVE